MRFGYSPWSHLEAEWAEAPPERGADWHLGLDLGQSQDFTALAALERTWQPGEPHRYGCRYLKRWALGSSYPRIVADVGALLAGPLSGARLAVDATGVGRPVADLFRERFGPRVVAVTITGGSGQAYDAASASMHVPKKDLVFGLLSLMQRGRLKIARALPEAAALERELTTFKVKVSLAGHESFEAWRERDHDDLVLALALATWSACRWPAPAPSGPVLLTPPRADFW
jgi:hypothetical protein